MIEVEKKLDYDGKLFVQLVIFSKKQSRKKLC